MAVYDAHYASTRKDKPCSLYPVCTHRISVNRSQHPRREIKPALRRREGKKKKNSTTPPTKPQALLFLNPRLRFCLCPASAAAPHPPSTPHSPPSTLNPRPSVQAVHDSSLHPLPQMFSQSIHFCDPISRWKKKKKPPHKPLMKCASYFFWMCQQFLAGWSDTTSWRCLLCLCHRVHAHVCVWGVVFVVAYVDLNIFTFFALLFLLFLHGAEGKRPCHSSTT